MIQLEVELERLRMGASKTEAEPIASMLPPDATKHTTPPAFGMNRSAELPHEDDDDDKLTTTPSRARSNGSAILTSQSAKQIMIRGAPISQPQSHDVHEQLGHVQ